MRQYILDACCGARQFWFDKNHPDVLYMDNRERDEVLCNGQHLIIKPDIMADFRRMPFPDATFSMVVFDPPHMLICGKNSDMGKKYDVLNSMTWQVDISQGFRECFRVLRPQGFLIFKWCERDISLTDILRLAPQAPLFGNKDSQKTHWIVFLKDEEVIKP